MPGRFFRAISQALYCSQYIASKSCVEHIGRRIFRVARQLLASHHAYEVDAARHPASGCLLQAPATRLQGLASLELRRSRRRAFRGYRMSPLRIIVSLVVALLVALAIVDFAANELQDFRTSTTTYAGR